MKRRIAIIGGGPSGCVCAYYALKNAANEVTIFDSKPLLTTILPTGHGRCNFAYAEFDFKELAKNYPRGEKFLYSIFSQFATSDTLSLFDELGIKTYMQDDLRFFPVSNKSSEIKKKFTDVLNKLPNFKYEQNNIDNIEKILADFDFVVLACGSNYKVLNSLKELNIPIIPFKQALCAYNIKEKYLHQLTGVTLKNVCATFNKQSLTGDILITHSTISGPLIYKISSLMAFEEFPFKIFLNLTNCKEKQEFFNELELKIRENNNKNISNVISDYVTQSFGELILTTLKINKDKKCHQITKAEREMIAEKFFNFELNIINTQKYGETVNAGGVDTDYINPKSCKSKIIDNLFVIGELLNVDGFCGGFNLQNCWSTGAVCGKYLADTNS